MKRGLEALDESKFFVDLGDDGSGQGVPPPNTMLYLRLRRVSNSSRQMN
jgi:hypothetical protein